MILRSVWKQTAVLLFRKTATPAPGPSASVTVAKTDRGVTNRWQPFFPYTFHRLDRDRISNDEGRMTKDECWNRCAQSFMKSIEYIHSSIVILHSLFPAIPSRGTGWRDDVMLLLRKPDFFDFVFAIVHTDDGHTFHGYTAGS